LSSRESIVDLQTEIGPNDSARGYPREWRRCGLSAAITSS
jgi:hypothetical protein